MRGEKHNHRPVTTKNTFSESERPPDSELLKIDARNHVACQLGRRDPGHRVIVFRLHILEVNYRRMVINDCVTGN